MLRDVVGDDELALDVLLQDGYPSLGNMLFQNGTTLWEAWEGTPTHQVSSPSKLQTSTAEHLISTTKAPRCHSYGLEPGNLIAARLLRDQAEITSCSAAVSVRFRTRLSVVSKP